MIREAIILAGGLGTRLREAVPDLPKCMAPVNGIPFLEYVIRHLKSQGIEHFIFSLGYKHEVIEQFIKEKHPSLSCSFVIEKEPLGTGGAIQLASGECKEKNTLVLNGDTLYAIEVKELSEFHEQHQASCTLTLKPMHDFDRYGVVEIDKDNHIQSFLEKKAYEDGLINGGVYALHIASLSKLGLPDKFSFEKDYLEKYFHSEKMMGIIQDEYFIDIGIPEDYDRASRELFL